MKGVIKFSFCFLFFFYACKKDQPPQPSSQQVSPGSPGFVYILNEGNFMASNGSVTRLNLSDGSVVTDYYASQNNNASIGDVPQSMCAHNGNFYVVVNNSNKILVINKYTFQVSAQITGFNSPRFILPVSNSKAYVSDLYAGALAVVDLINFSLSSSISLPGWSEEMALAYGKVFVTNRSSAYVYVLNTINDQMTDSIHVGYGSNSIGEDKNGKLWVLSQGNATLNIPAQLTRINPLTNAVEATFTFSSSPHLPHCLRVNGNKDVLYFLDVDGVYRMPINGSLPSTSFIAQGSRTFYGLGVDPQNETVYVSDAIDYNQQGKIFRYASSGSEMDQFTAGIIPGYFYFDK